MYSKGYHDKGTPAPQDAASQQDVTLEIDGQTVTVPDGTSIMRAAALADVDIPRLCATDTLKAFGSCRLCLVEIEGRRGYPASCTTLVADGIRVRTESPTLSRLRRNVMELYLSDHRADCGATSGTSRCELHEMARRVGVNESRYAFDGKTH